MPMIQTLVPFSPGSSIFREGPRMRRFSASYSVDLHSPTVSNDTSVLKIQISTLIYNELIDIDILTNY